MNTQRTPMMTHFGPLFLMALGGWTAFNVINSGAAYLVPGFIVSALLAYAGTLVALRLRTVQDLRATYPAARMSGAFPAVTAPPATSRPAWDDMDVAAGD